MPHHQTTANSNAGPIAAHLRRDPRAPAVRDQLALASGRRLHRLAARDGVRAARARQARRGGEPGRGPACADGVSRRALDTRGRARRRRVRRRDHHGVQRPEAHRRRRPRAVLRRSTSITTRATPTSARINWFDGRAAACAEMVFDVIVALGVPLSVEIATHIYMGILTDTGSFHYSSISARTFDICRQLVDAGVDPPKVARSIFDSNTLGRLKLFGAVLSSIELEHDGRLAVVVRRPGHGGGRGRHLRRYRGAHQPAAHRARDPGSGLLQGDRQAPVPREHALEGRRSISARWPRSSAAAATRTRPAAP